MENKYIYMLGYIALLIAISYIASRGESEEDFLMSGRNRNWLHIMASKFAGSIGISWFIVYTGYAYEYGVSMYFMLFGFLLGYMLFALWVVPKVFSIAKKEGFYTQGDLVYHRTKSNIAQKITNYYSSIVQFLWLTTSLIGGAKVMSEVGILSYQGALFFTTFTLISYIILAGYKAVIITDIFQAIITIVLFVIITMNVTSGVNIIDVINIQTKQLDVGSTIGVLLYGTLTILSISDRYQLMYASKTQKDITRGMFYTFIPISIVGFFVIFLGLYMFSLYPGIDPDLVFLQAIMILDSNHLISIAIVMMFAGLMSSADTNIYSISSHIVLQRGNTNKQENIIDIRFMTIVIVSFATGIAYFFRDIIGTTIIAGALTLTLSIPMIYVIKGGTSSIKFFSSIIGGVLGGCLGIIFLGINPSIAITVLGGSLLGLIKK